MELTTEKAMSGDVAPVAASQPSAVKTAESDPAVVSPEQAREAAARMFRSIRAGRSWVRAGAAGGSAQAACVTMKPGNDEPPVFMIPGAPGSILQLGPFTAALPMPMPVFAIKPRGLEEGETPCETIAEMATYAIGVMRAARPEGPYPLIGYSAGGLIALEMAQQLRAAGEIVPVVTLLDTYTSKQTWPLASHVEILLRHACRALRSLLHTPPSQIIQEIARRAHSLSEYLGASGVVLLSPPPVVPEGWSAASRRVHVATFNAGEAYRPLPYSGKVVFVQPEIIEDHEPSKPGQVWRRSLSDFAVCRVPGTHIGLVEDNAATTAAAVGQCLARILSSPPPCRDGSRERTAAAAAPPSLRPSMGSPSCP